MPHPLQKQDSMLDVFSKFNAAPTDDCIILDLARKMCGDYLGGVWKDIDNSQFSMKKLSGGLTNLVFHCELSPAVLTVGSEPRAALIRIQTQSDSLQLMKEIAVFVNLCAHGRGPKLLAIFPGGRIEEFIPSRTPSKEEFLGKRFLSVVAKLLAKVHIIEMPLPKSPQYTKLLRSLLQRCYSGKAHTFHIEKAAVCEEVEFPERVTMEHLEEEFSEIEKFLSRQRSPSVFCHNDVVPSNILVREAPEEESSGQKPLEEKQLMLIDFEFGCYNYRAMEIANTLAEFGMTYGVSEHPGYKVDMYLMNDDELLRTFCTAYLEQLYEIYVADRPADGEGSGDGREPLNDRSYAANYDLRKGHHHSQASRKSKILGKHKLKCHLLTGDVDSDLELLMSEGRRFLPLPHFFWAIWNIICMQELGETIQGMDFKCHFQDRLILYYHFKENMYKY